MGGSLDLADQPIKSELVSSLFSKNNKESHPMHSGIHMYTHMHVYTYTEMHMYIQISSRHTMR